ncbi:response regulator [Desulfosarcina ovata]|uniref:histidine kinase n=1 Tax=Desulfosarcina ovata subsp. ovata TaxID=2752305 RepID=A0A5K8AB65_9BACT|nr:response regulator [Desulfosarcina ovata]BBO89284.1 hypothetical protein DSCOOX_24640 [Desulfosarcina ovata subsp. ovata]
MLRSINSKFYAVTLLLAVSFAIGYGILIYFLHQQTQSVTLARDTISLERRFSELNTLFHEVRFWERVIFSQKNPDAEMQFGSIIEQIRNILDTLSERVLDANTNHTLKRIKVGIDQYENNFNRLIQLKTKQSLLITRMEMNYRSMVSIILNSNDAELLKPLFNLTHFLIAYRSSRGVSRYQALKLVINSFERKFLATEASDVRMKGYLQSFKEILDEDHGLEGEIITINEAVENLSVQLNDHFAIIKTSSKALLSAKFEETTAIKKELQGILLIAAVFGITTLMVIIWFLDKNIISPIRSMASLMQKVEAGSIGMRFQNMAGYSDEIVQLGFSFNNMLNSLESNSRKLIDYQQELEKKIDEISEQELESQRLTARLQRAQKMESLGLLAGGVAHDLNNVLSGIVGIPDLLLFDLPTDSQIRKSVLMIQEAGNRAVAIVQDLLTVARGVAIAKEPIDLNHLIDDFLKSPEFRQLKTSYPNVSIKTELDPELLDIAGSHIHIKKVLMNLILNAMEAIDIQGVVNLSTTNRYIDRPLKKYDDVNIGEYAVISVSDDGKGISHKDLERIFEPFYTKKIMGRSGTGLGLAIVWNVLLDHDGYIDVKSGPNDGTVFELYFPITREAITGKNLSLSIDDYFGNGETILIIDDVESQREISSDMLNKIGYHTVSVSSGEDAVEYMKNHSVDLLLLDMIMDPGIDGRETYKRIIEIHPNQKAVIVSGYAETEAVKKTQNLGAGNFVKKPFTIEKIGLAVKQELNK